MTGGIWIYGSLPPEPGGGVCVFVQRLIRSGQIQVEGLVDPYFGKKDPVGVPLVTATGPGLLARLKALSALLALKAKPLLVNASMPRAVLLLSPFLARRKAPTALLLHHGNLGDPERMPGVSRRLLRVLLGRFDSIGCLSKEQLRFYKGVGVEEAKLSMVDIYMRPAERSEEPPSETFRRAAEWIEQDDRPLVIASGPAKDYYRHEWPLEALDQLRSGFRYLLCCYGPKTDVLASLQELFARYPDALLVFGLGPSEFERLLDLGDIYARPTDVESFGIAVRDASTKGLAIVASDASERPPGYIHRAGDKADFLVKLDQALANVGSNYHSAVESRDHERTHVLTFLNVALLEDGAGAQ